MRSLLLSFRGKALRAAGVAVALFIFVNLAGEALRPPFDTLDTWVTLPEDPWLRHTLAAVVGAALLAGAFARRPRLRWATGIVLGVVAAFALVDTGVFYVVLARGLIRTPAIVPASLLVAAFFAALARDAWKREGPPQPLGVRGALVAAAVLLALPLVRMLTFGPTRYEHRADCAVVFGARVWNDGRPSDALADRVDEAIGLYRRGLVTRVLMSGGVEPENGLSEAHVMRARAEAAGVPREAIFLDEAGVDTASTVRNTSRWMHREGLSSALVVTHYYHEPRAKMLFDRASVKAYTVPAKMQRRLYKEPYYIAREVGAYWHSFAVQ